MKLNSPESIAMAEKVFREYGGSWSAARDAARRADDGVLVIPRHGGEVADPAPLDRAFADRAR